MASLCNLTLSTQESKESACQKLEKAFRQQYEQLAVLMCAVGRSQTQQISFISGAGDLTTTHELQGRGLQLMRQGCQLVWHGMI